MSETIRLGDVCAKIGSGATPRGGKDTYSSDGPYALIRSQNIYNDKFSHDGLAFISEQQAAQLSNVKVQADDVLLNITGDSVARVCQVDKGILPARVNQHVAIIRPDPDILDAEFLRYFLVTPEMQAYMLAMASAGATRNALTKSMIENFRVPTRSMLDQKAIASILGSLDDKIDLNRRMNETLEQTARALFKDWFVDFGPTKAKMAGQAAYLETNLWALFPERLDEAGMPEGWFTGKIETILERLKVGKLYDQKSVLLYGEVPVFDQGKSGIIGYHNNAPNIEASPQCRIAIFANHTCFQKIVDYDFSTIQNVIPYIGNNYPTEWVYYATLGKQEFEEYKGHWPSLMVKETVRPSRQVAVAFKELVDPLLAKKSLNDQASTALAQTRDLLLPKLMSGELRVRDAEAQVAEVL